MLDRKHSQYKDTLGFSYYTPAINSVRALAILEYLTENKLDKQALEEQVLRHLLVARANSSCSFKNISTWLESLHWTAIATIPYLSKNELIPLWVQHKWLNCKNIPEPIVERLKIYKAVSTRDGVTMARVASKLLEENSYDKDRQWGQYLLTTGILGYLTNDKSIKANGLWETYGAKYFNEHQLPVYMKLLTLHMSSTPPTSHIAKSGLPSDQ